MSTHYNVFLATLKFNISKYIFSFQFRNMFLLGQYIRRMVCLVYTTNGVDRVCPRLKIWQQNVLIINASKNVIQLYRVTLKKSDFLDRFRPHQISYTANNCQCIDIFKTVNKSVGTYENQRNNVKHTGCFF